MNIWLSAFPDVFSGRCRSFVVRLPVVCRPTDFLRSYSKVLPKCKFTLWNLPLCAHKRKMRSDVCVYVLQRTESCNSESLPWWQTLMCYHRWAHWIIHSSKRRYGTTTKSAWYDHKLSVVYLWNGYLARTLRKIIALCQLSLKWSSLQTRSNTVGSKIPQNYSLRSQSNSWPYWLSDFKKI